MQQLGFEDVISWSFLPSSAPVSGTLGESLIVYHCVDEFSAFSGAPVHEIRELERRLLLRSDVVICSSEKLRADKARVNSNAHRVQHGVDLEHFANAFCTATTIPDDLKGAPGPIIGFWGLIADWVDLPLVRHVADAFSGGTVVLLGNSNTDMKPLDGARNVRVLGRRHYADLPRYAKAFDVALMPFKVNELTLAANPLKVREYLAAGLPVVSTAIPEVERLGVCRIGKDADGVAPAQRRPAVVAGASPTATAAAEILREAQAALRGELRLFGQLKSCGVPIDHHRDPLVPAVRYDPSVPGERVDQFQRGADAKVMWELGRLPQLWRFGQAFRLTGDPSWARAWEETVRQFRAANAKGMGVQWACAMEVSLRATTVALTYGLVQ